MFPNKTVLAVARILAVTVLLDRRQRDREMIEFCHYVMTLNQEICSVSILPREKILTWFESEKGAFAEALASDTDDAFKSKILQDIADPALQKEVLTAIFAICVCDYELRDEEAHFIRLALSLWKSELPSAAAMARMAG